MSQDEAKSAFKAAFIARTKKARKARKITQAKIAGGLGLAQDTYKQYETRSLLPHDLMVRFCLICDVELDWLFCGEARAAATAIEAPAEPKRRARQKRKARAA